MQIQQQQQIKDYINNFNLTIFSTLQNFLAEFCVILQILKNDEQMI